MRSLLAREDFKRNLLCLIFSLFLLSSVLTTPLGVKICLYTLTLTGLFFYTGYKNAIKNNFFNYSFYLIFTLICAISYLFLGRENSQFSESPQIVNIIALFVLFVFLIAWKVRYLDIMNALVFVISLYLVISIPIHLFFYESSLLSATAFFSHLENESLSNKNTLGILLSVTFPFCLFRLGQKVNIHNYLVVMLFNFAIFYTFSRAALILSVLTSLFFLFSCRKNLIKASSISIISILVISFFFDVTPKKYNELKLESTSQVISHSLQNFDLETLRLKNDPTKTFTKEGARFNYIKLSFEGFLEKPFFGHGLTKFRKNNETLDNQGKIIRKPVTHNDYAQIIYEMGLLGLISFFSLFIFNFLKIYKTSRFKSDESINIFIQCLILAISLNSGNYIDHSVFWMIMGITLLRTSQLES